MHIDEGATDYYSNKSVAAAGLLGCDAKAAAPGLRETSAKFEAENEFELAFKTDCTGTIKLIVKAVKPPKSWSTDLAFTCCAASST